MANKVYNVIENCVQCLNYYTDVIWTQDSFEHERGAYCGLVEDTSENGFGKNGKHKLIATDDWDLSKYTLVPDWCPLLEANQKPEPEPDPEEIFYQEYLDYINMWILAGHQRGDSPLTYDQYKSQSKLN